MDEDKYNPLLTQREIEHNTYLRIKYEYMDMKEKRKKRNRAGIIFIPVSGIVFLVLMFSLETKIIFLNLWIISIFAAVAFLIRNEYKYYKMREYLGFEDNCNAGVKDDNNEENIQAHREAKQK